MLLLKLSLAHARAFSPPHRTAPSPIASPQSTCNVDDPYYDYAGAFRGVVEGACDVAFTKHSIPLEDTAINRVRRVGVAGVVLSTVVGHHHDRMQCNSSSDHCSSGPEADCCQTKHTAD